jgi:hypothetical protein
MDSVWKNNPELVLPAEYIRKLPTFHISLCVTFI